MALEFRIELEIGNVGFWGEVKTGVPGETPLGTGENEQQTQPAYDAGSENRTRATLEGGERSHRSDTPAPQGMHENISAAFVTHRVVTRFVGPGMGGVESGIRSHGI